MADRTDVDAEWWTTSDVADYLGVQIGTVSSYRNRGQMPPPEKTVGRTHLWAPRTIVAWNEGRSPRKIDPLRTSEFLQVATAVESRAEAEKLVRATVENKLSAGAQIAGPVISAFWHLGKFGTGEEWHVTFKTHASRYAELEQYLLDNHPWDNPEISAVPIVAGSSDYLGWIRKTVGAASESENP
ncbi:divalent cation tolerance protein CutA [Actinoplanes sp. NBRC 103695]|uniref:divalent cation tolerance protein CutA n=1 Tax=Actinoplanes sp. NBRC 103695 TaxID=3032202 RepID=UPI002555AB81|nr:divalent cation tolerance protein CutA [Actinoplanes sp. NBRC 103695]